ncbi:Erythronate-4-phosphate dehydrogenase family protein [Euphorbia peplus]|nr:Erythronate-4-phosphate dehydrogenase family protein [Euphorbia peplus]
MDHQDPNSNPYNILSSPSRFEIRLFYVRITPCVIDSVPDHLTLVHLRPQITTPLEINGSRVPGADSASVTLRRDRLNKESSEVTYVSTDNVQVAGGVEFEVLEGKDLFLCGSLERMELGWENVGGGGLENDVKTGWSMECYLAASVGEGGSEFFQPKMGVSAPGVEVYIAGCCGGVPVILSKTILVSPRRKGVRCGGLDVIPEDEETEKENGGGENGLVRLRKVQVLSESEGEEYDLDGKTGSLYYAEDMYYGEDGQLSWFNAGVRVGVGIGLGMCLGIGIGVGLLMRSYQATTRNFRRRFS